MPIIKFSEALRDAADLCLERDENVYMMGLGVPDPKAMFGTTAGLSQKYGDKRVFDLPISENGMTGIALGTAITGMRPIMTHQRLDFAVLAMEQIVNQAAKWHYMFGGQMKAPMVMRMIIGRGWGQGPQHSQNLQAWFAHVPGLKVVMPSTPRDAKGLFISAVEDNSPVVFLDHRWLHNITGEVPEGYYKTEIGPARIAREGKDVTIVSTSYMTLEALRAAEILEREDNLQVEVLDLQTIHPLDSESIIVSLEKTGRLIVSDTGTTAFGIGAEIISLVAEYDPALFVSKPVRVCSPDHPVPCTPALANHYYRYAKDIVIEVRKMHNLALREEELQPPEHALLDIPDKTFTGPF